MNRLFLHIIFLLIALVFGVPASSFSSELHAIVVCDTHAVDLEAGVKHDYKHIKKELKKIAGLTGLELSIHTFKGYEVNSGFMDLVKKLQAGPDDVILFYWSGHGTHYTDQDPADPWPYFDFEYDSNLQSLLSVAKELMKKNARLVLAIADCCNDYQERGREESLREPRSLFTRKTSSREKEGYNKLFVNSRGVYIATAALPGEASIALDEKDKEIGVPGGSFFTNALLETLHRETEHLSQDLSWELVFEIAAQKTIVYQLRDQDDQTVYHHPHYQCLLR